MFGPPIWTSFGGQKKETSFSVEEVFRHFLQDKRRKHHSQLRRRVLQGAIVTMGPSTTNIYCHNAQGLKEWLMEMDPSADFFAKQHNWVISKTKQRKTKGQKSCGGPRCWLFCTDSIALCLFSRTKQREKQKQKKQNFFSKISIEVSYISGRNIYFF